MEQHVSIFKIVIVVNVNWDFLGLIAKRVSKQFRLAFKWLIMYHAYQLLKYFVSRGISTYCNIYKR